VNGTIVPLDKQMEFGLVTLTAPDGTCSASMLNPYWALTAAHCVYQKNPPPAPPTLYAPSQITLSSAWGSMSVARRIVDYTSTPGTDIALIQTTTAMTPAGRGLKLYTERLAGNSRIRSFGRGIHQLASWSGTTRFTLFAVPSRSDDQYRFADFDMQASDQFTFRIHAPPGGAINAGGDSGSPSFVEVWDNPDSIYRQPEWQLVGLAKSCQSECLGEKVCRGPTEWKWVEAIPSCTHAAVFPIINRILEEIDDTPPKVDPEGQFGTAALPRALYALSIDESLVATGTIRDQLTFERCHAQLSGCPDTRAFTQWLYDPASHRLRHAPSGNCLSQQRNISGPTASGPGAPIILFPCVNAADQRWSMIESSGVTTIKNDLTGMCLHAESARAVGPLGTATGPATLVQRPCISSDAQRFGRGEANFRPPPVR
jgi:hypothetical protein